MTDKTCLSSTATCISGTPTPRIGETNMERAGSNAFTLFTAASARRRKVWPLDKFCRYGEEVLVDDLFRAGYVDMAILNSTYLYEFYNAASRVCASAALKLP